MTVRMVFAALLLMGALLPADAVQPDEVLANPVLELRARALSSELRCLVCQNQSIDDSDAALAKDLRLLVRERLVAGDSDDQIKRFLVERYGNFVLLRPALSKQTLLLWSAPFVLLLVSMIGVIIALRRRRRTHPSALSEEEQVKLRSLLQR